MNRFLGRIPAGFRHEVVILDRVLAVISARRFPVGTVLEGVLEEAAAGLRFEVRSARVPSSGEVPPAPPGPRASVTDPDGEIARQMRAGGVAPSPEHVARVAALVESSALPPAAVARAAARLITLGLPLMSALVRGGAALESSVAALDPAPAVRELIQWIRGRLPESEIRSRIITRLEQGAALAPGTGAGRVDAPLELRLQPQLLGSAIALLVREVLSADRVLVAIRAALGALGTAPAQASAGEQQLQTLVETLLGGAERDTVLNLVRDLGPGGRTHAMAILREMHSERVTTNTMLAEVRETLRAVQTHGDALTYAGLLEWGRGESGETAHGAGVLGDGLERRVPYRVSVRDQRRGDGEGSLGFVIEVEARGLGRVRVSGRLEQESGALALKLAAVRPATGRRIETRLAELVSALEGRGYRPSATVAVLREAPEVPAAIPEGHGEMTERTGADGVDVRG